jgi:hypothetical protein
VPGVETDTHNSGIKCWLCNLWCEPYIVKYFSIESVTLASTQNAVKYLINHDYLYEAADGLKLVGPLMRTFILERYRDGG